MGDFLKLEYYASTTASLPRSSTTTRRTSTRMETIDDLKSLAVAQNPVVGYFDPLKLAEGEFWGQSNEATIGFLRHAEIKHGRVAMAGFVGYCVHENGIRFPFQLIGGMENSAFDGLSAPDLWDKIGLVAQLQIIAAIGIFEFWSEKSDVLEAQGEAHY